MLILILLVFGLAIGSFLGAYTYRYPRDISIGHGRSFCPRCKKTIYWYNNIPLFSFLFLRGRCSDCGERISLRYPTIELLTGVLMVLIYSERLRIIGNLGMLGSNLGLWTILLLFVTSCLIAVFVIDFESQFIPDETSFLMLLFIFGGLVFTSWELVYVNLLAGLGGSIFLLLIHLVTGGRGMGLGDVKLAIPLGMLLGPYLTVVWLFSSFIIGGIAGVFLLFFSSVTWRSRVAFGPFLVVAFFITLFWGGYLKSFILPI